MGIEIPEEYGGQGGSFFQAILAVEELSAVDPSAGVIVDVQNTICNNALLKWASSGQKAKYLPKLAANTVASYALSEAGSGSDAFAMATRAQDRGDHFLLNGRKLWITNAAEAGFFLLFANADPAAGYKGVTAFLVERDFPGFQVGKKEDKLGLRSSSTCELILDNCRVPRENVMGEIGKGYKIAIETLNEGRIAMAKASDPEPASESAYDATMLSASRGRYLDFCSAVAHLMSALLQMVFCTSTITPADGSTADSSSTASTAWKKLPPCPPYSSGISMPISPISKNWRMRSLRNAPASSISRT